MTSFLIAGFERGAEDSRGKEQSIVYHCVIDGRAKALSKGDLLRAIEITLREGPPAEQPIFVNGQFPEPVERNDVG